MTSYRPPDFVRDLQVKKIHLADRLKMPVAASAAADGLYVALRTIVRKQGRNSRYVLVRVKRNRETIFESKESLFGKEPFPSKLLITQLMLL